MPAPCFALDGKNCCLLVLQATDSGVDAVPAQGSSNVNNVLTEDEEVETQSSGGAALLTQVSWSKVDGKWDGGGPYWRSQLRDPAP